MLNMDVKEKTTGTVLLSLPIEEYQMDVISSAAASKNTSLQDFVIDNAYRAASQIVTSQSHFVLSSTNWEHFCRALDEPPRDLPALRELFNQPSVFHE